VIFIKGIFYGTIVEILRKTKTIPGKVFQEVVV